MQINPLFFETPEVTAIGSEFGAEGELTVIRLLCAIGKDDYYMRWDHMHKMAFIGRSVATMTSDLLDRIVDRMAEYGLIDAEMLESAGVITSAEIQRQYVRTMGRARCRRRAEWPYLLICLPTAASGAQAPDAVSDTPEKHEESNAESSTEPQTGESADGRGGLRRQFDRPGQTAVSRNHRKAHKRKDKRHVYSRHSGNLSAVYNAGLKRRHQCAAHYRHHQKGGTKRRVTFIDLLKRNAINARKHDRHEQADAYKKIQAGLSDYENGAESTCRGSDAENDQHA